MKSCFYECHVTHARFAPRRHRFAYRLFLFAIDLDELGLLQRRLRFFSVNRRNFYSFRDTDYLPTGEPLHPARRGDSAPTPAAGTGATAAQLKARVIAWLAERGVDLAGGRVLLVTLPRVLGYGFNPVSFYFCADRAGHPVAAIAEVTNTFREIKPYFLGPETQVGSPGEFRLRCPKNFYVSPYSDVDLDFDFSLRPPDDRLAVQIDDYAPSGRTFTSMISGRRREITGPRLVWFTLKYPLITVRVITLIHWQALLLWLKRVPWFAKAARAAEQRELYRPHPSLTKLPPALAGSSATPGMEPSPLA